MTTAEVQHDAEFRQYVYPEHPLLKHTTELNPYEYVKFVRSVPQQDTVISGWLDVFDTVTKEGFRGISTDGTPIPGLFPLGADEGAPTAKATAAAEAFLATLSIEQRTTVSHDLNSRVWRAWMNPEFYVMQYGLRLEELSPEQLTAALALIKASTSERGYEKIVNLMRINEFLGGILKNPKAMNFGSYNINIYGTPGETEPWGWNFWGHHVCMSSLFLGKQQVFTPVFFGAEPNLIDEGEYEGTTELGNLDRVGLDLAQTLTPEQRAKAVVYDDKRDPELYASGRIVPGDELHMGGLFQDNNIVPVEGIVATDLTPAQQDLLTDIVEQYLDYQPDGPRAARVADFRQHLDATYFSWFGGTEDDSTFYYRVQSPVIMVEFDHHGGLALSNHDCARFHIHTTIRTPNGNDYGVELVRQATCRDIKLDGPA